MYVVAYLFLHDVDFGILNSLCSDLNQFINAEAEACAFVSHNMKTEVQCPISPLAEGPHVLLFSQVV